MLIASVVGLFVIGVYEQIAPLHASLYGQEDDCVRLPLLLSQLDFNDKNALLDIENTLHGFRSAPWLWNLTRDAVFAALEMYHKEQEYILRQVYAELALWIFVWFGAQTSLWYHGNQGQACGRVVDCVFTHFDNMLAATVTPILHLFVGILKEKWEIIQSKIVGPGREGGIMHKGLWTAKLFDGGCGICQSPFVMNILRNLGKSDCGQGATLGYHDFCTQRVSIGEILQNPLQSDISLNHRCASVMSCVSTRPVPHPRYCNSRLANW